jgi:hypothetical protein
MPATSESGRDRGAHGGSSWTRKETPQSIRGCAVPRHDRGTPELVLALRPLHDASSLRRSTRKRSIPEPEDVRHPVAARAPIDKRSATPAPVEAASPCRLRWCRGRRYVTAQVDDAVAVQVARPRPSSVRGRRGGCPPERAQGQGALPGEDPERVARWRPSRKPRRGPCGSGDHERAAAYWSWGSCTSSVIRAFSFARLVPGRVDDRVRAAISRSLGARIEAGTPRSAVPRSAPWMSFGSVAVAEPRCRARRS